MMSAKSFHVRIVILSIVVCVSAALLVGKLFYVQVVHAGNYKDRADHQYVQAPGSATARGTIYLTEKDGLLIGGAVDEAGYKLAINPSLIKDSEVTYQALNEIVPIEHSDFTAKTKKTTDPYEEIAFKLNKVEADKITALKLPGVSVFKSKWRFYPGNTLAAQTLGFVAYKDDAITGRYGLEYMYNDVLAQESPELYVNFFAQIFSSISKSLFSTGQADGNLVTTIEPNVQGYFDDALKDLEANWNADQVGGIIIDPKTGEIIAMASSPGFDLNSFQNVENASVYSNPNVESVFEFGSVIKPLVMAAAINEKVVTPETTYTDLGSVTVDKKIIYNFDKKARGLTTMQGVLNESLNTGMVFVEGKLGKNNERDYLYKYGLGAKTGIDLPNETRGLTDNLKSPRELEYATAAFGQGIALTPVQAVRAFSVLANAGVREIPHVVRAIKYDSGSEKELEFKDGEEVISAESARTITDMLVRVVDEGYAQYKLALPHYSVAAKTGTAQIPDHKNGGYIEGQNLHSMFGYFPAQDPKFLVLIYTKNPKGVKYAVQSTSPTFFDVVKFLLSYYNVAPDR